MKNILLLIYLLLTSTLFGQSTIKAIYKFIEVQKDDKKEKNISETSAELIFTNQVSVYKLTKDSRHNSSKYKLGNNVYTSINPLKIRHFFESPYQNVVINYKADEKWEFHKETKIINNYTCYKATLVKEEAYFDVNKDIKYAKKNYTAWYCPEINSKFGPNVFAGLPGLIFQVDLDTSGSIVLVKLEFNQTVDQLIFSEPKNYKEMTTEEFHNFYSQIFKRIKKQIDK